MLGIDIVDLKDPQLGQRTDRTFRLVQSDQDILIEHPEAFWILWAAKEAVFKCRREAHNFTPTQIPIQLRQSDSGEITFTSDELNGKIILGKDYILAICGDLDRIAYEIFTHKDENWSENIREMIIDYFRDKGLDYYIASDDLNLPILGPAKAPISISHHGRYGAVAFPGHLQ